MKALLDIYELLPQGKDFKSLSLETQEKIVRFDKVLLDLTKKKIKDNKRTAEYIARKRKENPNYAR